MSKRGILETMSFAVFYGVPTYRAENTWLHKELSKYGNTKVIEVADFWYRIGRFRPCSKMGICIHFFIYLIQSFIILLKTSEKDVIFIRDHGSSLVFSSLIKYLKIHRKIIAFNWIEMPKKHYRKFAYDALKMSNYIPVVNDCRLIKKLQTEFLIGKKKIYFFPDTYDTNDVFVKPRIKINKYVFAGGINNRDWKTLLQAAEYNSQVKIKLVVNKYLWHEVNVPDNVEVIFDCSPDRYKELLRGAFICVIPLKEDKVSGLVNIIKSHQYGIPCITTDMGCTNIYYPENFHDTCLYEAGSPKSLAIKIQHISELSAEEYIKLGSSLQNHLRTEFSPTKLVRRLIDYLRHEKWIEGEEINEICGHGGSV